MPPSLSVVIPWRPSPGRERHLNVVTAAIRAAVPDARIVLADSGHRPFSRAASRNAGARQTDSDLIVACDADTIVEPRPLRAAIGAAVDGRLHLPYSRYRALSRVASEAVLDGLMPDQPAEYELDNSMGGCLVVARRTWRAVGGWDERFTSWGFEDTAFGFSVQTLFGLTRHDGTVRHLWHCDDRGLGTGPWRAGKALCDRYTDAAGDPAAIRALIEERHVRA